MKKIMAFVLAVLMLASSLVMAAAAATPVKSQVESELVQLKIDGKTFKDSDYPVDKSKTGIQVLAVAEKGFRSLTSSQDFGLYIYVYNPSGMPFDDSESDVVNIGVNLGSESYSSYGLEIMSKSRDHRFYKFKIKGYRGNALSSLYKTQYNEGERVYNISVLHLFSSGESKSFAVGKLYVFTGFDFDNTLACSVRDFEYITVELHDTSWVSPNAGDTFSGKEADKYDHYEVHSVYFSIDSALLDQYDYISSIRASYEARKLTPIVVTRPGKLSDATVSAIEAGKNVSGGEDIDDLVAIRGYQTLMGTSGRVTLLDWWYSEKDFTFPDPVVGKNGPRYDQLVYLFQNDEIPEDFDLDGVNSMLGFTSDQLRERYYELVRKGYHSSLLYSESSGVQELDYRAGDMFHLKSYAQDMSAFAKWWLDVFTKDDSYLNDDFNTECEKIKVIRDASTYANISDNSYKQYGDELYINECDMEAFKDFCKTAAAADQAVVILRYAVSDYRCVPVYDVWEFGAYVSPLADPVAMSIEKSGYFNVSVAQIGFTAGDVETIIPVVSNRIDSFGDGIIFDVTDVTPGINFNGLLSKGEGLINSLKGILMVLAVVAVIIVLIIVVPKIFGAAQSIKTSRRLRDLEKRSDKPQKK